MPKIKAIIFDLDGTLRDTKKAIYDSYGHALKTHTGSSPTEAELLPHIHHHSHVRKAFASTVDEGEFLATYFDKVHELMPAVEPYLDAHETVEFFNKAGYKLAIVTTATFGADYLRNQGVDHLFSAIVGGNDTKRHKPYPDPVLKALELLEVSVSETVMVGDMTVDVRAAKAAKLTSVIGITHGFETREMLEKAGADFIIDNFKELPKVISKIEQNGS